MILTEGYSRAVEYRGGQAFEIIYSTEKGAFDYWESNKDDAAGLWAVAKILFDRDGTIDRLKIKIKEVLNIGKKPIDEYQFEQFRFDSDDALKYVETILIIDPTSANLILTDKIFSLTELFFDIQQIWIPPPKQRLIKIKEVSFNFYVLLFEFYQEPTTLKMKLELAKKIVQFIFEK